MNFITEEKKILPSEAPENALEKILAITLSVENLKKADAWEESFCLCKKGSKTNFRMLIFSFFFFLDLETSEADEIGKKTDHCQRGLISAPLSSSN